ncbi:MAG: hypothetical protein IJK02_10395, partial [Clostridia bacterium]|nr:hypothetical protein [Clostridia bacterium]
FLANRQVDGVKSVQSDEKIYCAIRTPELCGVALRKEQQVRSVHQGTVPRLTCINRDNRPRD